MLYLPKLRDTVIQILLTVKSFCVTISTMPKSPSKRTPKDDAGKQPRPVSGKEKQEEYGWRNVLVWVIPLGIGFVLTFISIVYGTHRLLAIWAAVGAAIAFLLFFLFLAEWYVWKEGSERATPRRVCGGLCVALIIAGFFWQTLSRSDPAIEAPRTPTPEANSPSPPPSLGEIPKIGASPSTATNGRQFLDIDPEKLFAFFEKYNDAQAEGLVRPYIGKWLEMQGRVTEVRNDDFWDKKNARFISGITVQMETARRDKKGSTVWTRAEFDEQRWIDRAFVLKKDEDIKVRGQIKYIFAHSFRLQHCEIIE